MEMVNVSSESKDNRDQCITEKIMSCPHTITEGRRGDMTIVLFKVAMVAQLFAYSRTLKHTIFGWSENFACAKTMPNTGPNFLGHMSNTL